MPFPQLPPLMPIPEAQALLRAKRPLTVLDVRNAADYEAEPVLLPGALKREAEQAAQWLEGLPRTQPVLVYCQHGQRLSKMAYEALHAAGFQVSRLEGGLDAWRAAQGDTEPAPKA